MTPAVRPTFVKDLVDYMVAKDYDGIDVDWEGLDSKNPDEAARLEALVIDLRKEANARPRYQDRPVIITYPTGNINTNIDKVTPQIAEEIGAANTQGAIVIRMMRGSEAYDAGVRPGDVIVGFNGTRIDDPSQLYRLVADAKIGSTATIKVFRNGRTIDVKVPIVSDARRRR